MINQYFDKLYIITMKKNTERHEYIKKLFSEHKIINYKFIYGIEGEKINTKSMIKSGDITKKMINMPNPVGTFLTHKDAWLDMVKNNYNQCVFFEDDVYFLDEFTKNFNNFMAHVPQDWSLLQLGWLPPNYRNSKDVKINNFVMKNWSSIGGAHFYALNKNSVKIFIDNSKPIKKAIDGYLGDLTNLWTKKEKNIYLHCYSPIKCFAIDCSHNHGNKVFFKSHGIK